MAIELPKEKIPAKAQDPKNLILFSKPKKGKSSAAAALKNNLCIDLEEGYAYIDAMSIECKDLNGIKAVCKAILAAGCPYDFITIDTVTALEEIAKPLALTLYQNTAAGKNFTGSITDAPMGAGYGKLREAVEMIIDMVSKCAKSVILVCHTKDASIADSDLTIKTIDLTGKTGRILASKSDAIGYLDRDENSNTTVSFDSGDKYIECGSRPAHLRNKKIVLGEMQEDGTIVYHWERIYPSLEENK